MRYVAAYLLAALGGNKSPSEEDIKKILASVGSEYEADKSKKVVSELNGKSLEEVMNTGKTRLSTIPSGGGGAPAAAASGAPAAAAPDVKGDSKKEEKKEEEEEEDEDMGFGLFD